MACMLLVEGPVWDFLRACILAEALLAGRGPSSIVCCVLLSFYCVTVFTFSLRASLKDLGELLRSFSRDRDLDIRPVSISKRPFWP